MALPDRRPAIERPLLLCGFACAFALAGCVLFGPGADDDDDDDGDDVDNQESGGVILGSAGTFAGASAGSSGLQSAGSSGSPRAGTSSAEEPVYSCYESATSSSARCMCHLQRFAEPQRCKLDWACCLLDTNSCECTDEPACDALAASRPGTQVVATCPPNADDIPVACADDGESCSADYLQSERLEGCCDELVCKTNASGIRACAPGSAEEVEAAKDCIDGRIPQLLTLDAPLRASVNGDDLELPFAVSSSLSRIMLDDAGAIASISLELAASEDIVSSAGCSLSLLVGPEKDASGAFLVSAQLQSLALGVATCVSGFDNALFQGTNVGTLSVPSARCEVSYQTCVIGDFVLWLDGTLSSPSATGGDLVLTFAGEEATLSGKLCGS